MKNVILEKLETIPFSIKYIEDVSEIHFQVHDGWSMKSLISDIANTATQSFVAVYDDRALAFCSYLVTDDAELLFVCTHPSYRRMGIATKLITDSLAMLPQTLNSVVLEVRSRNRGALEFYKTLGFEKLGVRKDFYSTPKDDAIVMEKTRHGVKELD